MRLFVSVDLADDLAEPVRTVQDELADASGLDVTDPTQAHVTLKFLGEVDEERVTEIEDALAEAVADAELEAFEATFGGLGAFPSTDYIRVVWLGVEEGGDELSRLQAAVEERLVALGFEPEEHAFTPHVTLARMQHAGGKERVQELLRERDPTVGTMTVDRIRLTESELTPEGSVYSTVAEFPLVPP